MGRRSKNRVNKSEQAAEFDIRKLVALTTDSAERASSTPKNRRRVHVASGCVRAAVTEAKAHCDEACHETRARSYALELRLSQLGVRRRIISEGGVARRYTGASSSQRVSHGGRERPLWRRDERAAPLWKTCHVQYFLDAQRPPALMIAKLRRAASAGEYQSLSQGVFRRCRPRTSAAVGAICGDRPGFPHACIQTS